MKTIADIGVNRLQKVLYEDKKRSPERLAILLKSDLVDFLKNFMEIDKDNLIVKIVPCPNGSYNVFIKANTERIKMFNLVP